MLKVPFESKLLKGSIYTKLHNSQYTMKKKKRKKEVTNELTLRHGVNARFEKDFNLSRLLKRKVYKRKDHSWSIVYVIVPYILHLERELSRLEY